ncbi:hypothetical protein JCM19237_255 [Photobacterium aphoticum]|uniref:Uncharacterized protein n=1 Tax=Photobacterium aphoticum TaxID=754436 RepID=A0A090QXD6_9GAMM|nr:hypothetical protein JCM19237_255 [Photobacterium aphoticum]
MYFMASEIAERASISLPEALAALAELRKSRAVTCRAGFKGKAHERVWQLKDIKRVLSKFHSNFS